MVNIRDVEWDRVKLTVVMPLYNRREYMEQAIDSVLMQKTQFQVLLVIADDASTDGSMDLAMEIEKKNPTKILVISSEKNQGLLANDIRVFEYMHSDYFCVLDPDDYWVDEYFLQKAVTFLEAHPDYAGYGSNTKRLINGELEDQFYVHTNMHESTAFNIEDYLTGRALVAHTTGAVYRNIIFKKDVPAIMKESVGTLAEASFRGDVDRYVMHLKYGKARFVNEWVGVYRIHEKGICQGGTMFHWMLMNARAELDYSRFYNDLYQEKFEERAKYIFKIACTEIYKASVYGTFFSMDDYDKENFVFLMNRLSTGRENTAGRTIQIDFREEEAKIRKLIKNNEKRKLIVWGTGASANRLINKYDISVDDIFFFIDGSGEQVGNKFWGKEVVSEKELKLNENMYVIIMSSYYEEILKSIRKEKLCSLNEVVNLFWYDEYVAGL